MPAESPALTAEDGLNLLDYYQPRPVQARFHASKAMYPLMEGGRGGGKTMALLWEAIRECIEVNGCNCLLLRRTFTAVEKGEIEDHFTKYVPRSLYRRYNSTKQIVTFGNPPENQFGASDGVRNSALPCGAGLASGLVEVPCCQDCSRKKDCVFPLLIH